MTKHTHIANLWCEDVVTIGHAPYTNQISHMQPQDRKTVARSLSSVGMKAYVSRTMDKISDGECQHIMITRALTQGAPVILLDEPTSFLSTPNRYELCSPLARLAHIEGKYILFSTHELDIALSPGNRITLIDTPAPHCLPISEVIRNGYIKRLFNDVVVQFDPVSEIVKSMPED